MNFVGCKRPFFIIHSLFTHYLLVLRWHVQIFYWIQFNYSLFIRYYFYSLLFTRYSNDFSLTFFIYSFSIKLKVLSFEINKIYKIETISDWKMIKQIVTSFSFRNCVLSNPISTSQSLIGEYLSEGTDSQISRAKDISVAKQKRTKWF